MFNAISIQVTVRPGAPIHIAASEILSVAKSLDIVVETMYNGTPMKAEAYDSVPSIILKWEYVREEIQSENYRKA